MSAKKRQTFDKMNRERAVRERRARKQEKRELRKLASQAPPSDGGMLPADVPEADEQPARGESVRP
jgi:hypothetical protein